MERLVHLVVESGLNKGREITVPPGGVRIGRSSRNDVVLNDAVMSRFHCRIFFKPGEGLWVTDLGSANGTQVDGVTVQEARVPVGGRIGLGDTTLKVLCDAVPSELEPSGSSSEPSPGTDQAQSSSGNVDLGLRKDSRTVPMPSLRRRLLAVLVVMCLAAIAAFVPWKPLANKMRELLSPPPPPPQEVVLPSLELSFERVEGTASNVFRYFLQVQNNVLVVQVDDLVSERHVRREKRLQKDQTDDLGRAIEAAGFFDLLNDYSGMAPAVYEVSDISVTLGRKAHRSRVLNHVEPDSFANVRSRIEEFGKNELGLAALAIEPEQLVAKARDSFLLGQKLYDEREVNFGNLGAAIRAYKEVEWYLETIEPKPDFNADASNRRRDCERELQKRYDDYWFIAERSVKLRDWQEAARNLRIVCELIPDRSDERYQNAYKKLVDIERRLSTEK